MTERRGRILLVDDDEGVRNMVRTALEKKGFEVIERGDATALADDVAAEQPDLIVLDEMMPGIGGMAALRRLREDISDEELPVIMLTAKSAKEDIVAAFRAGASDFLTKPPKLSELFDRVTANIVLRAKTDRMLGNYKLGRRLGEGGMGVVFEAFDTENGRPVALKVLRNEFGRDEAVVARLFDEARFLSTLSHENLVLSYGAGQALDAFFMVMERVHGETLHHRELDPRQAAAVGRDVARALAYMHNHQLLHRDVKPGNIFIEDKTGRGKLFDLGAAHQLGARRHTLQGIVIGTPIYMAPERFEGNESPASDAYSLGCTLFEVCSGAPPFSPSQSNEQLHRQKRSASPRVSSFRPAVPVLLDTVIAELMRPNPDDRPQSLSDVAQLLETVANG